MAQSFVVVVVAAADAVAAAGFQRRATPPLFHPNFRGVPFGLDCRCCGSENKDPKLIIIGVINFELSLHLSTVTVWCFTSLPQHIVSSLSLPVLRSRLKTFLLHVCLTLTSTTEQCPCRNTLFWTIKSIFFTHFLTWRHNG